MHPDLKVATLRQGLVDHFVSAHALEIPRETPQVRVRRDDGFISVDVQASLLLLGVSELQIELATVQVLDVPERLCWIFNVTHLVCQVALREISQRVGLCAPRYFLQLLVSCGLQLKLQQEEHLRREEWHLVALVPREGLVDVQPLVLRVLSLVEHDLLALLDRRSPAIGTRRLFMAEIEVELCVLDDGAAIRCRDPAEGEQTIKLWFEAIRAAEAAEIVLELRFKSSQSCFLPRASRIDSWAP